MKRSPCDNLSGVAAALAAFDRVRKQRDDRTDLRLLLTRAEEVGFIGAVAACRHRTVPRGARLIVLENSKAFDDAPAGGGTIVRVGDRTSTFDPDLTRRVALAAEQLEQEQPGFRWRRRLMPGGTCEATAFVAFSHRATCVCLPLLHYHNMDEANGTIASESIDLRDYAHTVALLAAAAPRLAETGPPVVRQRLTALYRQRANLLNAPSAGKGD